jgi:hypothetical protein
MLQPLYPHQKAPHLPVLTGGKEKIPAPAGNHNPVIKKLEKYTLHDTYDTFTRI